MKKWNVVVIVLLSAVLAGWFGSPARSNQNAAEPKPVRWEYLSESVDANVIQSKLNEWAAQNWEPISIEKSDSTVETTDKTRLRVEKFQVTVRRVVK